MQRRNRKAAVTSHELQMGEDDGGGRTGNILPSKTILTTKGKRPNFRGFTYTRYVPTFIHACTRTLALSLTRSLNHGLMHSLTSFLCLHAEVLMYTVRQAYVRNTLSY